MADTNNIIPNGLRADVMRNKMENKDALKEDGLWWRWRFLASIRLIKHFFY